MGPARRESALVRRWGAVESRGAEIKEYGTCFTPATRHRCTKSCREANARLTLLGQVVPPPLTALALLCFPFEIRFRLLWYRFAFLGLHDLAILPLVLLVAAERRRAASGGRDERSNGDAPALKLALESY
jgi:hypothetical protein